MLDMHQHAETLIDTGEINHHLYHFLLVSVMFIAYTRIVINNQIIMALKGSKTTTGFIEWNNLTQLVLKLQRDKEYKFSMLISTGAFTGLRISDVLSLRWNQLIDKDILELNEKKTGKYRKLKFLFSALGHPG
jgi:integrase